MTDLKRGKVDFVVGSCVYKRKDRNVKKVTYIGIDCMICKMKK